MSSGVHLALCFSFVGVKLAFTSLQQTGESLLSLLPVCSSDISKSPKVVFFCSFDLCKVDTSLAVNTRPLDGATTQ